jgi:acyl-CoA reductase-like NAD-dependent aldehyde dehydrogenase
VPWLPPARDSRDPGARSNPYERQQVLLKLADLVERHFDELSSLDTLDMGAPITRTRGTRLRVLGMLRYYAGQATVRRSPPATARAPSLRRDDWGDRAPFFGIPNRQFNIQNGKVAEAIRFSRKLTANLIFSTPR